MAQGEGRGVRLDHSSFAIEKERCRRSRPGEGWVFFGTTGDVNTDAGEKNSCPVRGDVATWRRFAREVQVADTRRAGLCRPATGCRRWLRRRVWWGMSADEASAWTEKVGRTPENLVMRLGELDAAAPLVSVK